MTGVISDTLIVLRDSGSKPNIHSIPPQNFLTITTTSEKRKELFCIIKHFMKDWHKETWYMLSRNRMRDV